MTVQEEHYSLGTDQNTAALRFFHEESNPCLYDQMFALWQHSNQVCIATAFLSARMLNIITAHLRNAHAGISVRFLTGFMNDFNEPRVLEKLCDLFGHDNVRLYQPKGTDMVYVANFHVKSYLFMTINNGWTILLGSSNFTAGALLGAVNNVWRGNTEWNLMVQSGNQENDNVIEEMLDRFEYYWRSTSIQLDEKVLETYRKRWESRGEHSGTTVIPFKPLDKTEQIEPRPIQRQALEQLAGFRRMHLRRAAIIGATGIGKTMISAFDARESGAQRVLFIAHRAIILQQAFENFRCLFRSNWDYYQLGGGVGTRCLDTITRVQSKYQRPFVVFAMVQTLSNPDVYAQLPQSHFDYLIVDEFHHASANSYRRVLRHFSPGFLLGLTATPERMDGRNVLQLCDYNIALEVRIFDAIDKYCLSPFLYFAIYDETDYEQVRWTGVGL